MKRLIAVLTALVLAVGLSAPALANTGSDGPTPYTVGLHGITLPESDTFLESGHVNIETTDGTTAGIHFDPNNGHPGGQWIGKSYIPWEAFGIESTDMCVKWVQISHYNQHFGEGGQKPVGKACDTAPDPLSGQDEAVDTYCTEPANGTLTTKTTTTAWTQEYVRVNGKWALGEKVFADPVIKKTTSIDADCRPDMPAPDKGVDTVTVSECTDPANGTRTHTTTTTSWTQDRYWSQSKGKWLKSDKVYGEPETTTKVTEDEDCIPGSPDPVKGVDETVESVCTDPADGTLTTTTTATAWTQTPVWDQEAGEWVLGDKVFDDPEVTTDITADEDCIPEKPEPKSGTESGAHDYCTDPADGTRTHVMTETAWTQDWAWSQEAGEWVLGDKVYGETAESGLLTQDVECAAPETPDTPETPETPEKPDTPTTLATTGVDTTGLVIIAALMLVIGTAIALYSRRSK